MNVSELYHLTLWIEEEVEQKNIIKMYQGLYNILQQNAQQGRQQQPFETQKDALLLSLKEVDLNSLTNDQIKFLNNLEIEQALGSRGIETIEDILYKNVIDIATSASKIAEIIQKLQNGINKSKQIKTGLLDCVDEEIYEEKNEVLMRVAFTRNASMTNIAEFKNWGSTWYDIGRGIAMAHDLTPDDVKVVGATKGSIIIELAVIASIATTTSGIILAALKVAEKVYDIRLKAEELRSLKLKNDKVVKDLEKEADNEKKEGIDEIIYVLIDELKLDGKKEGDKITALEKSVKKLVDFVDKGGEVDFIMPDEENDEVQENDSNEKNDMRVAFQEIRRLEKKLALLEHKK